jgi:hypothetical protein
MFEACISEDVDVGCTSWMRMIKGRKEHKCCECRRAIPKGVVHERAKLLCEGYWSEYRTCKLCKSVRDSLFRSWFFGCVWDALRDVYGGCYDDDDEDDSWLDPPDHPIKLPVAT